MDLEKQRITEKLDTSLKIIRHLLYCTSLRSKTLNALSRYLEEFQKKIPGGFFETIEFFSHHQVCLAKWHMKNSDNLKVGEGYERVRLRSSNLEHLNAPKLEVRGLTILPHPLFTQTCMFITYLSEKATQ